MKRSDYIEANRAAWDEAAPVHQERNFERLLDEFRQPGFSTLDEVATRYLNQVGVAGKAVAQLCCNNGREILSIKNMGAGRCVGFDFSAAFLEQARQLAQVARVDCEFVCTDVYEIPAQYFGCFDLVYISIGVFTWLPDLKDFFAVAARLLRPGGQVLVYEMHPQLDMFEPSEPGAEPLLRYSYFMSQPMVEDSGLDYYGHEEYASATMYEFHHKLSDIFTAALSNAFTIEAFEEYGHDISNLFAYLEKMEARPPLSYVLLLKKS